MKHNNKWQLVSLKIMLVVLLAGCLYVLNRPKVITVEKAHGEILATSTVNDYEEALSRLNPALRPVCGCESSYDGTAEGEPQQFEIDGVTVRYGRINHSDRGMCQINSIHRDEARSMGMDIETASGNVAFANHLYETQGLKPWNWSKPCWSNKK